LPVDDPNNPFNVPITPEEAPNTPPGTGGKPTAAASNGSTPTASNGGSIKPADLDHDGTVSDDEEAKWMQQQQ
jgi:hypothetical protein